MGVVISPDSELGKELAKWDKPYRFEPFPAMVYKAVLVNGKAVVTDINPNSGEMHQGTTLIVQSEDELKRAKDQGWRDTPGAALDHHESLQRDIAQAAAEAAHAA